MRRLIFAITLAALPFAAEAGPTVITAFGNSLFAGLGVPPEETLPAQLERKLKADGHDVKVNNDSISGDTTAGGLARIDHVLDGHPDIVILELGANDMFRALAPEDARTNLDAILAKLKDAHIKVVVVGQKAAASFGKKYSSKFNPLFCELAQKYEAPCYPFFYDGFLGHPEYLQSDGAHPTSEGAKFVMEKLYPLIVSRIKK